MNAKVVRGLPTKVADGAMDGSVIGFVILVLMKVSHVSRVNDAATVVEAVALAVAVSLTIVVGSWLARR